VGGRPIRYEVAGEGEPVVLVHGLSGSTGWWARNVAMLAGRYRVYLVDLPGFGAMRRLRRQFALAEAASWLSAWMESVGLGRAHLVGHSMGGYVCLRLAANRPEAVGTLGWEIPRGSGVHLQTADRGPDSLALYGAPDQRSSGRSSFSKNRKNPS
jgi:pimeloyl-ACP methyl ester carboxylesterase